MSRRLSKQLSLRAGELDEMRAEWFQFDADTTRRFSAAAAIITTALPPLLRKIEASDETPQDVSDKVHRHTLRLHEHVVALRDLLADLDGIQLRMRQLQALWHEDVSQADLPVQELATPSTERAAPCEQVRLLDDVVVRHDEELARRRELVSNLHASCDPDETQRRLSQWVDESRIDLPLVDALIKQAK